MLRAAVGLPGGEFAQARIISRLRHCAQVRKVAPKRFLVKPIRKTSPVIYRGAKPGSGERLISPVGHEDGGVHARSEPGGRVSWIGAVEERMKSSSVVKVGGVSPGGV